MDQVPIPFLPGENGGQAAGTERKGCDVCHGDRELSGVDLENIEYDYLKQRAGFYQDELDEIVELMVETVCAKRKTTRIAGADFPHEVVRSRFLKLDSSHIEFVMDCLHKNTTEVRNIKQYLLTVLFNAPSTMSKQLYRTGESRHERRRLVKAAVLLPGISGERILP